MSDTNNFGGENNEQGFQNNAESFPSNDNGFQGTTGSYGGSQDFSGGTQFDPNAMPNYSVEPQPDRKGKSIAALVLGICGFLGCCSPIIGLVCGILGIVFGVKGRKDENAQGLATAGLVLGIITVILSLINWIAGAVLFSAIGLSGLRDLTSM